MRWKLWADVRLLWSSAGVARTWSIMHEALLWLCTGMSNHQLGCAGPRTPNNAGTPRVSLALLRCCAIAEVLCHCTGRCRWVYWPCTCPAGDAASPHRAGATRVDLSSLPSLTRRSCMPGWTSLVAAEQEHCKLCHQTVECQFPSVTCSLFAVCRLRGATRSWKLTT